MAAFSSHQPYHPLLLVGSASPAPSASCFPYNSSVNQPNAFPNSSDLAFLVEAQLKMNSASVEEDSPASAGGHTVGKRRKSRDCTSSDSAQLKDAERTSSKQRKHDERGQAAATGYIHVRARRGQATDSHSLAERVRREKIREKMNLLQGLVPGCDKVTGKALMLDEIINYVQSLQNQVEFLSMKLASVNPLFHNCGLYPEGQMDQTQKMVSIPQESLPIPPVLQNTAPMHHIATEESPRNYRMVETPSALVMHGQGAIALTQDNGSFLMQVADRRQGLLNQDVFHNICSFHPAD